MTSVVSGGTTDQITWRTCCKVLRAGSGMPARYSSTVFAGALPFTEELRSGTVARRRQTDPDPSLVSRVIPIKPGQETRECQHNQAQTDRKAGSHTASDVFAREGSRE